jgi:hypothetical protein
MVECEHKNWEVLIARKYKNGSTDFPYNYDNGVDAKKKQIRAWCRDCGAIHVYKKNKDGYWRDEWRSPANGSDHSPS